MIKAVGIVNTITGYRKPFPPQLPSSSISLLRAFKKGSSESEMSSSSKQSEVDEVVAIVGCFSVAVGAVIGAYTKRESEPLLKCSSSSPGDEGNPLDPSFSILLLFARLFWNHIWTARRDIPSCFSSFARMSADGCGCISKAALSSLDSETDRRLRVFLGGKYGVGKDELSPSPPFTPMAHVF